MDDNAQSFSLHGRLYWLDQLIMDIINYAVCYKTTYSIASKALGHQPDNFDFDIPEVELYEYYVKTKTEGIDFESEKRYMKARLWNIIDASGVLPKDKMQAIKLILEISIPEMLGENVDKTVLKDLKFDELLQLLDKVKS